VSTINVPRVLCVDDDQRVLAGLARILMSRFKVQTATRPLEALALLEQTSAPFAVIVSDLVMPEMDGIALLRRARDIAPSTTRVLLTGNADVDYAIEAVNAGAIFRFLTKPCRADTLISAVSAAAEQFRLIESERVLLEQTLRGAVSALTDVLTVASPSAFARGVRLKRYVGQVADVLGVPDHWDVEVAALISQLGCVSLPTSLLDKMHVAAELDAAEQEMVDGLPAAAAEFIAEIPRLDSVREILRHQNADLYAAGAEVSLGARILRATTDLDWLLTRDMPLGLAIGTLEARSGAYDPDVLDALRKALASDAAVTVRRIRFRNIQEGMVFAADVTGPRGRLLAARGQEVGPALMSRLRYVWNNTLLDTEVYVCDRSEYPYVSGA
jgi:response regulator RpfG family c-di-GMP phosphodiesterase